MIKGMDNLVSENAKFVFDFNKSNYKSSSTHVKHVRQLVIARGMDPQYVGPFIN
jgi:hypothetical protein